MKGLKRYYIKTYGCAMNYADSDRIRAILNSVDLKEVSQVERADLVIINSCSVRKQAEDKVAGWGIKKEGKKQKEGKIYVLTGCMAVRHSREADKIDIRYLKKIKNLFPWINYVVDIRDIEKLPSVLGIRKKYKPQNNCYLNIFTSTTNRIISNIPISTGCDFFCSYCIVPFARGELFHRDCRDIINEIKRELNNGVKLICLVAQNVNSWVGIKDGKKIGFAELLKDVAKIEGDFWITFVSSNPMDFSQEMIKTIAENKKIMRWINIAVQSGSDNILQKMNRRYTIKEFKKLIEKVKKEIPDIRLTTDMIVGFPTESQEDFKKSLDLLKKIKFQMVYIGKYSPRELTVSARMEDDVVFKEKKRREDILKNEVNKIRGKFHKNFVGKKMKILILGGRRGITHYYHEVIFEKPLSKKEVGTFVDALIIDCSLSGLVAKV